MPQIRLTRTATITVDGDRLLNRPPVSSPYASTGVTGRRSEKAKMLLSYRLMSMHLVRDMRLSSDFLISAENEIAHFAQVQASS